MLKKHITRRFDIRHKVEIVSCITMSELIKQNQLRKPKANSAKLHPWNSLNLIKALDPSSFCIREACHVAITSEKIKDFTIFLPTMIIHPEGRNIVQNYEHINRPTVRVLQKMRSTWREFVESTFILLDIFLNLCVLVISIV